MECELCKQYFPKTSCKRCTCCRKNACGECRKSHTAKKIDRALLVDFFEKEKLEITDNNIRNAVTVCGVVAPILGSVMKTMSSYLELDLSFQWFGEETVDISSICAENEGLGAFNGVLQARSFIRNLVCFDDQIGFPNFCAVVKNKQKKCVGFVNFQYTFDDNDCVITSLYILESYREKGLGTFLSNVVKRVYALMHQKTNARYPTSLQLMSEKRSVGFWIKQGFTASKLINNGHIHMSLAYVRKPAI